MKEEGIIEEGTEEEEGEVVEDSMVIEEMVTNFLEETICNMYNKNGTDRKSVV